jgi:hypothetical protein
LPGDQVEQYCYVELEKESNMNRRPDPITFARWSYILAIVSDVIIILALILGFLDFDGVEVIINIFWLAMITGGVGAFMGWAASSDFKRRPGPQESMDQARVGFRINMLAVGATLLVAAFVIGAMLLNPGPSFP